MTLQVESGCSERAPVTALLRRTVLAAFTILTAFSIRDTLNTVVARMSPEGSTERLWYTVMMAGLFLVATVLMAFFWQNEA